MEASLHRVLRSDELGPATSNRLDIRAVELNDRRVLLTRLGSGTVVAFAGHCPHQDTPLDDASLWEGKLRCPRHLYLYDLHTGENVLPAREARPGTLWRLKPGYLPIHRVEERAGWIWVAEEPEPPPLSYDPAQEKPPGPAAGSTGDAEQDGSEPSGPVVHPEEAVIATVGEGVEIVLPTSHLPGHMWRLELPDHPEPRVVVSSQGFDPSDPSRYVVRITVGAPGTVAMRWTYGQPWSDSPSEVRTFSLQIGPGPGSAA